MALQAGELKRLMVDEHESAVVRREKLEATRVGRIISGHRLYLLGWLARLGMLRRDRRARIGECHLKRLLRSRADHWFRRQSRGTFDAGQNDHHDNSDGRAEHDARCLEIGHLDDRTQPDDRQ